MRRRAVLCLIFLPLLGAVAVQGATLKPAGADRFFIAPNEPAVLRWNVESGEFREPLPFTVRSYADEETGSGKAEVREGMVEATVKLAPGFHELEFPATKQRFGIVALPAFGGEPDPFFALDGALSWLVRDGATREGLLRAARRSGIGMIRERLTWGAVHLAAQRRDWEGGVQFDRLRQAYREAGVQVLEMAHDAPAWMGRVGKYPGDLAAASRSWAAIARHWRTAWGALEVWNEPDIFFGDNLPADQYVPLVRAIDYRLAQDKLRVPIIGGVVAHHNREFLDTAAENGLLDAIDAFSFHTYGRAMEMESLAGKYRAWLEAHKHPAMPLWITECGRPWKRGPERPPAGQDAESALDITMKAVEARACGIARYFAFVYPYYDENDNNFGLMDKRATPLRSMAAYVQAARVLAGSQFLGDLRTSDKRVLRARLFAKGKETFAVVYTGKPDRAAKIQLGLPVLRAEGIDGRQLPAADQGLLPVPDGLAYVWLGEVARSGLNREGPALDLWKASRPAFERRPDPSPVVLRYEFDRDQVEPSSRGYRIKATPAGKLRIRVKAFNLSDVPLRAAFRLATDENVTVLGAPSGPISLPANRGEEVVWEADLAAAFGPRDHVTVRVIGGDLFNAQTGQRLAWPSGRSQLLAFDLRGASSLQGTLLRFPRWTRLPIQEFGRWKPAVSGNGQMSLAKTEDAPWRMTVKFKEGDCWAYPEFSLPPGADLLAYSGLLLRARCQRAGQVRVFLWEGEQGVGYLTQQPIVPSDGQWHVAVVRFADLALSTANAPDPDGRLDLGKVRRLSIGLNSQAAENALDVSDVYLVQEQKGAPGAKKDAGTKKSGER